MQLVDLQFTTKSDHGEKRNKETLVMEVQWCYDVPAKIVTLANDGGEREALTRPRGTASLPLETGGRGGV